MTKILRTAASRLAQGGNKYAEQRKKAQRRLRKCKKNELDDPPPQKLNYRLRLIFSIFLFSLLTFTLCTAPCAFAANGTLTKDTDGYYLIEDAKDLAAFRDGVNDGDDSDGITLNSNARLTNNITLPAVEEGQSNWTPIGDGTNKYAGTFDGRGHEIKGLTVNITDAAGDHLYAGLFGYIGGGAVKNVTVSGSVTVKCDVLEVYAGGIVGYVGNGSVENCKSSVAVTTENATESLDKSDERDFVGGIAGYISSGGKVVNCESSGGVKSTIGGGNGTYNSVGGIAGYNLGGKINNCTSRGSVEAYNEGNFSMTHAGGIVGYNTYGTVSNCVSYSKITAQSNCAGGIAGENHGTLENCIVKAESITMRGPGDIAAIVPMNPTGTVTNCAWVKHDNMPEDGVFGGDQDGVTGLDDDANVVTSLSASIDRSTITKGETATIKLTTGPGTPENAFDKTSGAVREIVFTGYDTNVITEITEGAEAGTYTVKAGAAGSTEIKITAELYATDFSTLSSTPAYTTNPTDFAFTLPVTVTSEAAPSQPGTSGGSGSTGGGGGGGGCSAGFGALALLAVVPLLFRRKK